ncbi:uncharacterized protein LOC133796385 [Humulus lupulus]|uniref:uncharacterized protein LOC133796385 n=1 Tax=Humulus lupulus TaxID=3486 RepID=UPI002B4070C4|nr:uncharacterized protein LOC133796385 [Humulus lupulus]
MALLFSATGFVHGTKINHHALSLPNSFFLLGFSLSSRNLSHTNRLFFSPVHFHRRLSLSFSHGAAKPGQPPPSPPESDPTPGPPRIKGLAASFSKFQDRMQIFFAVLFWMSLFFWTCAWDERNRPNKGSRFRR